MQLNEAVNKILKNKKVNGLVARITAILMIVTVFFTVFLLMNPASTISGDEAALCGLISHKHNNSCYTDGVLTCGLPEHEHDMACFSDMFQVTSYSCGFYYEHTHDEACYNGGVLVCSLSEHVHGNNCRKIENSLKKKLDIIKLNAAGDIASGTCGGTIDWRITGSGELILSPVSGSSGQIPENVYRSWNNYKTDVTKITVNSGVKLSGNASSLFQNYTNLVEADISDLDVSGATIFDSMFQNCTSLEKVDMSGMYAPSLFDMSYMFSGCKLLKEVDLTDFYTSTKVTMGDMFRNCSSLESVDFSVSDIIGCTSMSNTFMSCSSLSEVYFGALDTSTCTSFSSTFYGCSALTSLDLSNFDASSATSTQAMFRECSSLESLDLTNFKPSSVLEMNQMFYDCKKLEELIIDDFDTSSCTNMSYMFNNCNSLASADFLLDFDTSNVTTMSFMFGSCKALEEIDVSSFETPLCTQMNSMFYNCSSLKTIDISSFDTSSCTTVLSMFDCCSNLESISAENLDFSECTTTKNMFHNNYVIEEIDLSSWTNTDSVEDFSLMFSGCYYLESADLDGLVTSAATNLSDMFSGCSMLSELSIDDWSTSNVTDMTSFLFDCASFDDTNAIEVIESFDVSKVESFWSTFSGSGISSLDLSGWITSSATDMSEMFYYCPNLKSLDLSNFVTDSVVYFSYMFAESNLLESLDLSSFNTSMAEDMYYMFNECTSLAEIDVSSFDTSNCYDLEYMFAFCESLTEIDVSNFTFESEPYLDGMFLSCAALEELDLSVWDTSTVSSMSEMLHSIGLNYEHGASIILGPDFIIPYGDNPFKNNYEDYYIKINEDGSFDAEVRDNEGISEYQETSTEITTYVPYYSIFFNANDGSFSDSTDEKIYLYRAGEYWKFEDIDEPTLTDYNFSGWDTVQNNPATRIENDVWKLSNRFGQYNARHDNPAITFFAEWTDDQLTLDSETLEIVSLIETGDNHGKSLPAKTFNFSLNSIEAYGPATTVGSITTTGEGEYVVDFGDLSFSFEGVYHLEIMPTDSSTDGWVINKAPKIVNIVISEDTDGNLVLDSVSPVSFTHVYSWGIETGDLSSDDKEDKFQKNYTVKELKDILFKSAEWTDKNAGEGEIRLVFNNSFGSITETRAVYLFCTCLAHGFTQEIAEDNINFLRSKYKYVDVVSLEDQLNAKGFAKHVASFTELSSDDDVTDFLDTIDFMKGNHAGIMYAIDILTEYFEHFDPTAVYLSFDGVRGFGTDAMPYAFTDPIYFDILGSDYRIEDFEYSDEQMATIEKLAAYQRDGLYYLMTADMQDDYIYTHIEPLEDDYDKQAYRNLIYHCMATLAPAVFADPDGYEDILDVIDAVIKDKDDTIYWKDFLGSYSSTYSNRVYSYDQSFQALGIDIPIARQFSIVDVIDKDFEVDETDALSEIKVGFYGVDSDGEVTWTDFAEDYDLTVSADASGNTLVTVEFPSMDILEPIVIRIPIVTELDEYKTNDDFRATNIGDAYSEVEWTYVNSKTEENSTASATSTQTETPKLFKDISLAEFTLLKINDESNPLTGTRFALYTSNASSAPANADTITVGTATYYKIGTYDTGTDGKIIFTDLYPTDSYILKEIAPTAGYTFIPSDVKLSFNSSLELVLGNTVTGVSVGNNNVLTVVNYPGFEFPATGGIGTRPFIISGIILMAASALLIIFKKKIFKD